MTLLIAYWKPLAAILLVLAAFASGWVRGNNHGTQKLVDYQSKQMAEATRIAQARTVVTERVVTRYLEKKGATERVTDYIDREVRVYADSNPTGACIDANWLRLHDSAATNAIPKPPAVPSGSLRTTTAPYWSAYSLGGFANSYAELR